MSATIGNRILAVGVLTFAAWIALTPPPDVPVRSTHTEPDPVIAKLRARTVAKTVIVRELFAGRLTFEEATAVFGWLNRQPPPVAAAVFDPADPAHEARAVIVWAASMVDCESCDPEWRRSFQRMADQIRQIEQSRVALPLPEINTAECQTLLDRATTAADAVEFHPTDRVDVCDLRLVRPSAEDRCRSARLTK
jgi:hypothetical protein